MTTVITRGAGSAQALGYAARATAANYIEDVFSTYLYKGNGSTRTITNDIDLSTKGGLVWIKNRGSAVNHAFVDTVRGAGQYLSSDTTTGNTSTAGEFTSFTSSGFGLDSLVSSIFNGNNETYASWTFRKQAKFFDVVTFTTSSTTNTNQRISHSLGSTPGTIILKATNAVTAWPVWHRSLSSSTNSYLTLNTTTGESTYSNVWGSTGPTSTDFGINTNFFSTNVTYVAYLFAHDAGGFGASGSDNVITCGSFTTDGSSNATVNLGYEPQFVIFKRTDSATNGDWVMFDNMRGMPATGTGSTAARLKPNTSDAENPNTGDIKITSTGFVVSWVPSATMIYIAIRRGPMRTPTSGTSVYEPVSFTGNNATNTTRGSTVTTDLAIISATNAGSPQATYNQGFYDRLRGEDRSVTSSNTNAEVTGWANTYFNLDQQIGWSNGSNTDYLNNSAITYVAYNLRRAPGFFDVVCYTGNGTSGATQSHNLAAVPEMWIVKRRSTADYWVVGTSARGSNVVELNTNGAEYDAGTAYFSNGSSYTAPTSTAIRLGSNARVNASGNTYVAYLFATVAGVSKVGSYTGTGTTLQVNCGFTGGARFVLIKRTDSTGDWYVWDSARGIVAGNDPYLLLNSTAAEVTNTDYVDTYSAGFEISSTAPAAINANGGTFIFLAIA